MGELLLEWKDHEINLSTKLWEFFKEEYLVDFSVTCHGQQMKVHKFVLALLFPMLKESLRSEDNFSLDQEKTIPQAKGLNLDNIADHAEDMNYLIQFAYTGKATVPNEHVDCLMRIANAMEVKKLKDSLEQWQNKNKLTDKTEQNDIKLLSRLRPRKEQKKVIDESDDTMDMNDDSDYDYISDEFIEKNVKRNQLASSMKHKMRSRKRPAVKQTEKNITNLIEPPIGNSSSTQDPLENQAIRIPHTETDSHNQLVTPNDQVEEAEEEEEKKEKKDIDRNLKCPHCDYVTNLTHDLRIHLGTHFGSLTMRFTCKSCKTIFATKEMYMTHLESKCGECKYCDFRSIHKRNLLQHIMVKHKVDGEGNPLERNIKCSECDYTCFAKHQLRCHALAKHERINTVKCKECNYTAPYKHTLMKHIRIMHEHMKDYMCEECGFRFQTSGSLNRHVRSKHYGLRPYKCDICSAAYSHNYNLKIHKLKHVGDGAKNHVCHICGQAFFRRDHLRVHCTAKHKVELPSGKPNFKFPEDISNEMDLCSETIVAEVTQVQNM